MMSTGIPGPAIRVFDPWMHENPSARKMHQLLSDDERTRLAVIATVVQFRKRDEIYREGDRAEAVFNIIRGVVKACQQSPDGTEQIAGFLFAEDLFGLAQEGRYANSIKTLTPVTAYRIPTEALQIRLLSDAALGFHVITKLCQELLQAQRHAFLLANKRTVPQLVMFLQMLEQLQAAKGDPNNEIHIPMDRSDTTSASRSRPSAGRSEPSPRVASCKAETGGM
jgi:CRP-like cAMP-binding protein